jgi:hypothetical protein
MNRNPVSLLSIIILSTLITYAQECPTCHATIHIHKNMKNVNTFKVKKIELENKENKNDNYPILTGVVIPLDNNEPITQTSSIEQNNSNPIVITDESQKNLDSNHSILEQNIIYACEDSTSTLVCDSQTKICECV